MRRITASSPSGACRDTRNPLERIGGRSHQPVEQLVIIGVAVWVHQPATRAAMLPTLECSAW
jgi:hypothetical protein